MDTFSYSRPQDVADAVRTQAASNTSQQGAAIRFLAGGTTLLDLMKLDVERPQTLVDIRRLPLDRIEQQPDGSVRIGALVKNATLAHDEFIKTHFPVLSQALLSGASAQLRNMATTAGNLLQRTRCVYFRDTAMPCNKRERGSGCAAREGFHRNLAILGTSEQCVASNPSDMNVALMALDAVVHITGAEGERSVPIGDFFLLPGDTPWIENVLAPGDLITHVSVPAAPAGARSLYLKLRDRASYEFALSSAAVEVVVDAGVIRHARIALGGVGTKPWRAPQAERVLIGQPAKLELFVAAAEAALAGAQPLPDNAFKTELAKRCLAHALGQVTDISRQDLNRSAA